jgi:hypothetical protein
MRTNTARASATRVRRGRRRTRVLLTTLALVGSQPLPSGQLPGSLLLAQEVHGVLRGHTPPEPVAGVVVTAIRLRDGEVIGRAVTGPAGSFRLVVGGDSVLVRALRIGQRPVTLFLGRLERGARHDLGQPLADEPSPSRPCACVNRRGAAHRRMMAAWSRRASLTRSRRSSLTRSRRSSLTRSRRSSRPRRRWTGRRSWCARSDSRRSATGATGW